MKFALAFSALISTISAGCTWTASTYGSTDCSGASTAGFEFTNLDIGTGCTKMTVSSVDMYIQPLTCQPTFGTPTAERPGAITFRYFSDSDCKVPVKGWMAGTSIGGFAVTSNGCFNMGSTSYKVEKGDVTGSPFGIGWVDGWTVLFCGVFLFGLC